MPRKKSQPPSCEISGKCPGTVLPSMNGDKMERFELREYPNDTLSIMHDLRLSGLLCDVTIKLKYNGVKREFPAHRLVLSACSPYFRAMFTGGCRERSQSEVSMSEIHPEVFQKLLDFAYTSRISVSERCVLYVIQGANMLQMTHVLKICCKFLESQLDPSNCIGLVEFAEELGLIDLKTKIDKYIRTHFCEVVRSDEFKAVTPCRLSKIIASDEMNIKCESEVYNAVLRWVQYDPDVRRDYFHMMLEGVRCHALTPDFLDKQLKTCPTVAKEPRCREYLAHIFKELTLHKPVKTKPRTPIIPQVIYVAGGYLRHSLDYMECYKPNENIWLRLKDLPIPRSGIAACVVRGLFYAIGGRNNSTDGSSLDSATCDRYNPLKNQWYTCSSMNARRNRLGVEVIDSKIYAVGGSDGTENHNTVERYDPEKDTWTMVSRMKTKRIGVGCAVANRILYAVGGYDGRNRLKSVEKYVPETDDWCFVSPMNTARSGAGVVAVGNFIYAVGGYDGTQQLNSVERYSIVDNKWENLARMKHKRSALALTVHDNKIFAIGGYDGDDFLSSVEFYDPDRGDWKEVANMTCGRSGAGAAVGFQPCLPR